MEEQSLFSLFVWCDSIAKQMVNYLVCIIFVTGVGREREYWRRSSILILIRLAIPELFACKLTKENILFLL